MDPIYGVNKNWVNGLQYKHMNLHSSYFVDDRDHGKGGHLLTAPVTANPGIGISF